MENIRKQFERELKNLEITEEDILTARLVTVKFRKKALRVHSDKTRGDDEEFKELLSDYNRVTEAVKKIEQNNDDLDVKNDVQEFFERHNFAKEFSQSWTIFIEKNKVERWNTEMEKRFPNPKALQGNGTQYKSSMEEGNVFTTLYNVLVPKMNIQGNHKCIRKFVIDVLPEIYRAVSEETQIGTQRNNFLPLNTRVKLSAEITYTCDVCDKRYVRKPALRKHIQIKHATSVSQAQNITSITNQPIPLLSIPTPVQENEEVEITLDEQVIVVEEIGPQTEDSNWQCSECGKMLREENELLSHMSTEHEEEKWVCNGCEKVFNEEKQLEDHKNQEHREEEVPTIDNNMSCVNEYCEETRKFFEKKLELLERRHEALKEKYDEMNKKNKEYSKDIFKYIKENTDLRVNAERDAEALADTLSINQVLTEEIKIKNQIIEANEIINNQVAVNSLEDITRRDGENADNRIEIVKCEQCDWTSSVVSQLKGHMLKHTGQYSCDICKQAFKTNNEMKGHKEVHYRNQNPANFICITCDKSFQNEHSFKQHMISKHKTNRNNLAPVENNLPVGHPDRYRKNLDNRNSMKEHENGFNRYSEGKICKYFRNGFCVKGEQCVFKHIKSKIQACKRGQQCIFLYQNRCKFFHEKTGFQEKRKECRFQENCWNLSTCEFFHKEQGFQLATQTNRPPQRVTNLSAWLNY